jgi:hypothetical protein
VLIPAGGTRWGKGGGSARAELSLGACGEPQPDGPGGMGIVARLSDVGDGPVEVAL